jgi:hypothetical protein
MAVGLPGVGLLRATPADGDGVALVVLVSPADRKRVQPLRSSIRVAADAQMRRVTDRF